MGWKKEKIYYWAKAELHALEAKSKICVESIMQQIYNGNYLVRDVRGRHYHIIHQSRLLCGKNIKKLKSPYFEKLNLDKRICPKCAEKYVKKQLSKV